MNYNELDKAEEFYITGLKKRIQILEKEMMTLRYKNQDYEMTLKDFKDREKNMRKDIYEKTDLIKELNDYI